MRRKVALCWVVAVIAGGCDGEREGASNDAGAGATAEPLSQGAAAPISLACPASYSCGPWVTNPSTSPPVCHPSPFPCWRVRCPRLPPPSPPCEIVPGPGMVETRVETRFCFPPWFPPGPICREHREQRVTVRCGCD
jgi:hypothetical protein